VRSAGRYRESGPVVGRRGLVATVGRLPVAGLPPVLVFEYLVFLLFGDRTGVYGDELRIVAEGRPLLVISNNWGWFGSSSTSTTNPSSSSHSPTFAPCATNSGTVWLVFSHRIIRVL
jgi:hypothetical protein